MYLFLEFVEIHRVCVCILHCKMCRTLEPQLQRSVISVMTSAGGDVEPSQATCFTTSSERFDLLQAERQRMLVRLRSFLIINYDSLPVHDPSILRPVGWHLRRKLRAAKSRYEKEKTHVKHMA
jgi:hypothetical protein